MAATEAKYFLHAAHEVSNSGGLSALLCDPRCLDVPVRGDANLFPTIPNVEKASDYCKESFVNRARTLSGELGSRPLYGDGIIGSILSGTAKRSFFGNQAVYGLAYKLLSKKGGINIQASAAYKHAEKHETGFFSASSAGSNLNPEHILGSVNFVRGKREEHLGEHCADYIKEIYTSGSNRISKNKQAKVSKQFSNIKVRSHITSSRTKEEALTSRIGGKETGKTVADIAHAVIDKIRVGSSSGKDTSSC
jgi:hypothetical protein